MISKSILWYPRLSCDIPDFSVIYQTILWYPRLSCDISNYHVKSRLSLPADCLVLARILYSSPLTCRGHCDVISIVVHFSTIRCTPTIKCNIRNDIRCTIRCTTIIKLNIRCTIKYNISNTIKYDIRYTIKCNILCTTSCNIRCTIRRNIRCTGVISGGQ